MSKSEIYTTQTQIDKALEEGLFSGEEVAIHIAAKESISIDFEGKTKKVRNFCIITDLFLEGDGYLSINNLILSNSKVSFIFQNGGEIDINNLSLTECSHYEDKSLFSISGDNLTDPRTRHKGYGTNLSIRGLRSCKSGPVICELQGSIGNAFSIFPGSQKNNQGEIILYNSTLDEGLNIGVRNPRIGIDSFDISINADIKGELLIRDCYLGYGDEISNLTIENSNIETITLKEIHTLGEKGLLRIKNVTCNYINLIDIRPPSMNLAGINLSKAGNVLIYNTDIPESSVQSFILPSNLKLPSEEYIKKYIPAISTEKAVTYEYIRQGYIRLKYLFSKSGDFSNARKIESLELEAFREVLSSGLWRENLGARLILGFQDLVSSHGSNPIKTVIWILALHLLCGMVLLPWKSTFIFGSVETYGSTIQWISANNFLWNHLMQIFSVLINPLSSFKDLPLIVPKNANEIHNIPVFIYLFGKLLYAILIYQLILSCRKIAQVKE